jgi:hypothetical protein
VDAEDVGETTKEARVEQKLTEVRRSRSKGFDQQPSQKLQQTLWRYKADNDTSCVEEDRVKASSSKI